MPDAATIIDVIVAETSWNGRVQRIRRIPEEIGIAQQADVYAKIAERVYVPTLKPNFAYIHWRDEYELTPFTVIYERACELTERFTKVSVEDLTRTLTAEPSTLAIFRLILGFIRREFTEICNIVAKEHGLPAGAPITSATAIDLLMRGELFPPLTTESGLRRKLDKPDTENGWDSVRFYSESGVPFSMFLHQREYGGAFRQLLDATSTMRGDIIEEPVESLFKDAGIPYIRTGAVNQSTIRRRFGLTIRPAPDFVVFNQATDALRVILECKGANDGGTARDKASRFSSLRAEANRLGGVPVFAVLGGLGWRRTKDALGPVIRDTDGRTFTVATLSDMLLCEPFPALKDTATR